MINISLFKAPITAPENQKPAASVGLDWIYKYLISDKAAEITKAFRLIPADDKRARSKHKTSSFDAVTFSGSFSRREAKALQEESRLLCLDLDHVAAQGWQLDQLKDYIINDANLDCRLVFVSPSGDGIKAVVMRPDGFSHADYFTALQQYFIDAYLFEIDKACSDLCRLCFLPCDPDAYYSAEGRKLPASVLDQWRRAYGPAGQTFKKSVADPEAKPGLVGAFCKCYSIHEAIAAFLPDVYEATTNPHRYTYTKGSSYGGLVVRSSDDLAFSHHGTDPAGGHARNAFDLVRVHKFGNDDGGTASQSFQRMLELARADGKVQKLIAEDDFKDAGRLQALAEQSEAAAFEPELQALLDNLHKVNFRECAEAYGGLKADEKLTRSIKLVVVVRELMKQIEDQGAGLTLYNEQAYCYFGGYWHSIEDSVIKAFLTVAAICLGMKPIEAQHYENQDKLYKQFEALARLEMPMHRRDDIAVNFQNGTMDIEEGKARPLRTPRRADFLTYQLPYKFDPAAGCPRFRGYLDRVLPDRSAQKVLAEFIGNCLAPSINLQKSLVLYGDGNNGKSVFCEIITALLGRENVSSYSIESLTANDSRSLAMLDGKLLNYCGENSTKLNADKFKTLSRTERIEARRLYKDPITLENYARLCFNCNVLPREIEQSEGYFRSFLIIPFKVRISEAEKDPQLASKIIANELPGVFNWVLDGLQRLLKNMRYTDCAAADEALKDYRKESSSVLMFIEENKLKPSTEQEQKISLQYLYNSYVLFCQDDGYKFKVNKRSFANMLRQQGLAEGRDRSGVFFYCSLEGGTFAYNQSN